MKPIGIGLLVAVSLVFAGCSSKPAVVGKWKVDPQMVASPPSGLPAGFMTGFAFTFKYEFKPDKTFSGPMTAGTYTVDGSNITMTTTSLMGQDLSKLSGTAASKAVTTGELAADGQSMTLHPAGFSTSMPALSNIKMVPVK